MEIRRLGAGEPLPLELLLLADPSVELVQEYAGRGICCVAERDGRAAGVYVLLPTRPGTAELVNVAVTEALQGQGIGKALVLHAIGHARSLGYKTVEVGTGSTGISQLALYQKCGFRMTWIDRDFFIRHYKEKIYENGMQVIDMVRMAIDL
ncbi:GNAT family N-acetyltransferase [Paenibacillus puerhi]|uniref:GNAT family N-acetyltransferase n=1 Tax=Paenibacillus puerhi TaxID=2692622 RepID=UPI0013590094|nr:GNAT family N-acetyltransferase [Paenibacillus puerhi]